MSDAAAPDRRSHTCGELRAAEAGRQAVLLGWVDSVRDHGGLLFLDLRDRYGTTQAVFDPGSASEAFAAAKEVRPGFVVAAAGEVVRRAPANVNAGLPTGEVEVEVSRLLMVINF